MSNAEAGGTPGWTDWQELCANVVPWLTMEDEVTLLELGIEAWIWWRASPYDQPQFPDGKMFYERSEDEADW